MPTAGCMRFSPSGRIIVSLDGPVINFNGGTPTNVVGAVVVEDNPPDVFLGGYGFKNQGPICARAGIGDGSDYGGLARDSAGQLALATSEPITSYIAGMPVVADGRLAVEFEVPPPTNRGFNFGFDGGFG